MSDTIEFQRWQKEQAEENWKQQKPWIAAMLFAAVIVLGYLRNLVVYAAAVILMALATQFYAQAILKVIALTASTKDVLSDPLTVREGVTATIDRYWTGSFRILFAAIVFAAAYWLWTNRGALRSNGRLALIVVAIGFIASLFDAAYGAAAIICWYAGLSLWHRADHRHELHAQWSIINEGKWTVKIPVPFCEIGKAPGAPRLPEWSIPLFFWATPILTVLALTVAVFRGINFAAPLPAAIHAPRFMPAETNQTASVVGTIITLMLVLAVGRAALIWGRDKLAFWEQQEAEGKLPPDDLATVLLPKIGRQ